MSSYAMARLLLRERSSPVEVRPGQTPAHSQPLIPYTTTRDTIGCRRPSVGIHAQFGVMNRHSAVRNRIPQSCNRIDRSEAATEILPKSPVMTYRFPSTSRESTVP